MVSDFGVHCPADLLTRHSVYVRWLTDNKMDAKRYEQGERINGYSECPKCGVWWPYIEEPIEWQWHENTGFWWAIRWWGPARCTECELIIVEQPDGRTEVYDLRKNQND